MSLRRGRGRKSPFVLLRPPVVERDEDGTVSATWPDAPDKVETIRVRFTRSETTLHVWFRWLYVASSKRRARKRGWKRHL